MPSPLTVIRVPRVVPITTGPNSFSNVLKMEKTVDSLYAGGGLAKFEVPRAAVPAKILQPGFEDVKTYKFPASALLGDGKKGTVYAMRSERPGHDYFALYTPKAHRLAVRQESGDYPAGFFWSNYQTKTSR